MMPQKFPIDKFQFKSSSILKGLPKDELAYLEERMIDITVKKGQIVFAEGRKPKGIFFLKEGKIKKYKTNKEGKEQIIYICGVGELLGYTAVLSDETYPDSAAAIEDSTIGIIPKHDFLHILEKSDVLSKKLLVNLSHEFGVLVNEIAFFAHKNVRERLSLNLLILKDKYRSLATTNDPVEINLTREDLANLVGVAVETLVRVLHDFKLEGIIETRGRKIRILNVKKLIEAANFC